MTPKKTFKEMDWKEKEEYLFGNAKVPKFDENIIKHRIKLLDDNLGALQLVHFMNQDNNRIKAISDGIDWHKNILEAQR